MWSRSVNLLNRATEGISMLLMVAMVLLIFMQIISRSLFDSSFTWTEEVARFILVWVVFLGAGLVFQYGANVSVEALFNTLPINLKKILQVVVAILCIIFLIILIMKGLELCSKTMVQRTPILKIPMGYVYSIIPISGVLQIINIIDITIKFCRRVSNSGGGH